MYLGKCREHGVFCRYWGQTHHRGRIKREGEARERARRWLGGHFVTYKHKPRSLDPQHPHRKKAVAAPAIPVLESWEHEDPRGVVPVSLGKLTHW